MRIKITTTCLALCACFLAGCVSTWQSPDPPDLTKRIEDSGKARLYVLRTAQVFGDALAMESWLKGPSLDRHGLTGALGPGGYLCWELEPGPLAVLKSSHRKRTSANFLWLELLAGHVYYVRLSTHAGLLRPYIRARLLTDDEGESLLKRCKPRKGLP
jgi:hypothetical protein